MKTVFITALLLSLSVKADDISNYRYYETNLSGNYLVYVKKSDPCIYAGYIKDNDMHKYCEMGNSGINLEKEKNSVYATEFTFNAINLRFTVAAPWNEQKCKIDLDYNKITCEPTGK